MNARILGLALAAAIAMPVAHAGVLSFNFSATGAGGTTPSFGEQRESSFHETGPRTNMVNSTFDEIRNDGNGWGYLIHYAVVTYDVAGYYTDNYVFSGGVSGPANAAQYAYISGTVTFDPTAAANMGTEPPTLNASMLFSGTYTPSYDPEFPTIPMLPAAPTLAIGYSNDKADLIAETRPASFYDGYFSLIGGASGIAIATGQNALEFLFHAGPNLDPGMTTLVLSGPAYDFGTYQRTDRTMLYYEPIQLPVPEPTTWAMLLAGVGILGIARRRKNAA